MSGGSQGKVAGITSSSFVVFFSLFYGKKKTIYFLSIFFFLPFLNDLLCLVEAIASYC